MSQNSYDFIEIDEWFTQLGGSFIGRLALDHIVIRNYGGSGWRLKTLGVNLVVLADRNFPYSPAQVFVENYDRSRPLPHIEPLCDLISYAKICLQSPIIPAEPLEAIKAALYEARTLIKANDNDEEVEDFENDFGLYWYHYSKKSDEEVLHCDIMEENQTNGHYFYKEKKYYCFSDKRSLRKWFENRHFQWIKDCSHYPIIELSKIPSPKYYPYTANEFIAFLNKFTLGGKDRVVALLRTGVTRLPCIFRAKADNGRIFIVALELCRKGHFVGRRAPRRRNLSTISTEDLFDQYTVKILPTKDLKVSDSRLPVSGSALATSKVVIVGCGAVGSGIAMMLAKSGVGNLVLIDPDRLGWENIRRHELGSHFIGLSKASGLKKVLLGSLPDMRSVEAYDLTVQDSLNLKPNLFDKSDIVISATADWGGDAFLSALFETHKEFPPVLYTWTEVFGLATHAVLMTSRTRKFIDGFDSTGNFKLKASHALKQTPPECGNTSSPFGSIELAQGQAMASRLALEYLNGNVRDDVWRSWTADNLTLQHAEGSWTDDWLKINGSPSQHGEVSENEWVFS